MNLYFQKYPIPLKYKYNDINSVKKLVKKYRNKDKSSNIYAPITEPFSHVYIQNVQ